MSSAEQLKKREENEVIIGGGTGPFNHLRGSVKYVPSENITHIPGTWDDGGSTGKLRTELGILPPGDARRGLIALMSDDEQREYALQIFEKRIKVTEPAALNGEHTIGNLILACLDQANSDDLQGINAFRKLFGIKGHVVPVSLNKLDLAYEDATGRETHGEHWLDNRANHPDFDPAHRIISVYFTNKVRTNPKAIDALLNSQRTIISSGSLFGSIMPHFRVPGVRDAIVRSGALLFYNMNIMTEAGQTDGFKASDHLRYIVEDGLRDPNRLDYVIINDNHLPDRILRKYEMKNQKPVELDEDECHKIALRAKIIRAKLASYSEDDHLVRHDPDLIAQITLDPEEFLRRQPLAA